MKKRFICFAMILMLILSFSGTAFASEESLSELMNRIDLGPTDSLQLQYAKLQLAQSEICKQQAEDYMNQIEESQNEQRLTAEYLNVAKQRREDAKVRDELTAMPDDMVEFMIARNLSYNPSGDAYPVMGNNPAYGSAINRVYLSVGEWDYVIQNITNYLEQIGKNTQTLMVYLQDFVGQYNSYTQGAERQISNSNQALTSIARGQSMYGDSEVGLAVTGLVLGVVLGCAATLAVQKLRGKKAAG